MIKKILTDLNPSIRRRLTKTILILFCLTASIFTPLFAQSTTSALGDVDGNGTVNIVDALIIAQYYVGLNPALDLTAADVDCNGAVNIVDSLAVARYYVGLTTELPCSATPVPTPKPTIETGSPYWSTYADPFGSTVNPPGGTDPLVNGTASASFLMQKEPTPQGDYPYAGMLYNFDTTGAAVSISLPITFSYKSTGSIRFSIGQIGLNDNGQAWGYDLPVRSSMTSITITQSMLSQPSWVNAPSSLNLAAVFNLKWEPKLGASGGAASISISNLSVEVGAGPTPTPGPIDPSINLNAPHTEPMVPKWMLGYIQSQWGDGFGYETQSGFIDHAEALRGLSNPYGDHKHPADIMVLDMYWDGKEWNWPGNMTWDYTNFPDPRQMIADLHGMNFKIMMNYHTGGSANGGPEGFTAWAGTEQPWLDQLKRDLDYGLDLVWLDFWTAGSDREQKVWNLIDQNNGNKRVVFMARHYARPNYFNHEGGGPDGNGGWTDGVGIQTAPDEWDMEKSMPVHWTGDVQGSWNGLAESIESIVYGAEGAMGGWSYLHSDTGGHSGSLPDEGELMNRWIQFSDFSTTTRNHAWTPRHVWAWGPEIEENSRFSRMLRYRLLPYIYTYCWKIWEEAVPLTRPFKLAFPGQRDDIKYQYMFGEELMVALVYKAASSFPGSMMDVYLPAGEQWIDYWNHKVYNGGEWIKVNVGSSNLKYVPLYVKRGAIIPMGPEIYWIDTAVHGDPMTLDIYPLASGTSTFTLYDDDGESMAYQTGEHSLTDISCTKATGQITVSVGASTGNYSGKPSTQNYILKVNLINEAYSSVRNGTAVFTKVSNFQELLAENAPGNRWAMDDTGKVLYVKFQTPVNTPVTVVIGN